VNDPELRQQDFDVILSEAKDLRSSK